MPKTITLVQKGTEGTDRTLKTVKDTPELQELLKHERCSWELYIPPPDEDDNAQDPDSFIQSLQDEDDAAAPSENQQLVTQFGSDAEIAKVTLAAAQVAGDLTKDLPKEVARCMTDFLKRQTPLTGGVEQLDFVAQQAKTAKRAELEAMGLDVSDTFVGHGTKYTSQQMSRYYRAIGLGSLTASKQASDFADDPVVLSLLEGTDASGGFLVPDDHVIDIIKAATERINLWPRLRVRPTSRDVVKRPVRSSVADVNVGSSAADELADVTETTITWAEKTWTVRPFDAYFPVSAELLNDADANIEAEVRDAVGEQFAEQREKLPLVGAGSGSEQPQGIQTTAGITETAFGAAASVAKVLTAVYAMDDRYRTNNSNLTLVLRGEGFKGYVDDLAKNYLNPELLKLPQAIESRHLGKARGVIGDMSYYWVYINPQMRLLTQMIARSKKLDMVFWERWDGQVVQTDAFVKIETVTYT